MLFKIDYLVGIKYTENEPSIYSLYKYHRDPNQRNWHMYYREGQDEYNFVDTRNGHYAI